MKPNSNSHIYQKKTKKLHLKYMSKKIKGRIKSVYGE